MQQPGLQLGAGQQDGGQGSQHGSHIGWHGSHMGGHGLHIEGHGSQHISGQQTGGHGSHILLKFEKRISVFMTAVECLLLLVAYI
jgi:hypothetical protein